MAYCPLKPPMPPRMATTPGQLVPAPCDAQCAWFDPERAEGNPCVIWRIADDLQELANARER